MKHDRIALEGEENDVIDVFVITLAERVIYMSREHVLVYEQETVFKKLIDMIISTWFTPFINEDPFFSFDVVL